MDRIVTVEEEEIAEAIRLLSERQRIVVDGAGAIPLAALVNQDLELHGKNVLLIVPGGNIDPNVLGRIVSSPRTALSVIPS